MWYENGEPTDECEIGTDRIIESAQRATAIQTELFEQPKIKRKKKKMRLIVC